MESDRYADESYGYHDGFALTSDHSFAKDDERSRNKARNGANATTDECQQPSKSSIRSMFLNFVDSTLNQLISQLHWQIMLLSNFSPFLDA